MVLYLNTTIPLPPAPPPPLPPPSSPPPYPRCHAECPQSPNDVFLLSPVTDGWRYSTAAPWSTLNNAPDGSTDCDKDTALFHSAMQGPHTHDCTPGDSSCNEFQYKRWQYQTTSHLHGARWFQFQGNYKIPFHDPANLDEHPKRKPVNNVASCIVEYHYMPR